MGVVSSAPLVQSRLSGCTHHHHHHHLDCMRSHIFVANQTKKSISDVTSLQPQWLVGVFFCAPCVGYNFGQVPGGGTL